MCEAGAHARGKERSGAGRRLRTPRCAPGAPTRPLPAAPPAGAARGCAGRGVTAAPHRGSGGSPSAPLTDLLLARPRHSRPSVRPPSAGPPFPRSARGCPRAAAVGAHLPHASGPRRSAARGAGPEEEPPAAPGAARQPPLLSRSPPGRRERGAAGAGPGRAGQPLTGRRYALPALAPARGYGVMLVLSAFIELRVLERNSSRRSWTLE